MLQNMYSRLKYLQLGSLSPSISFNLKSDWRIRYDFGWYSQKALSSTEAWIICRCVSARQQARSTTTTPPLLTILIEQPLKSIHQGQPYTYMPNFLSSLMGNKISLEEELINLRLTSKQMQRASKKCEKNEKEAVKKLKKVRCYLDSLCLHV